MKAEQAERRAKFLLELRARGLRNLDLLRAMERAPRALFLPQRYEDLAWRDLALPIPSGQTASRPFDVAAMIEALEVTPHHRVLEIGAGAGYATALLAQCADEVVALERCEALAAEAAARLQTLGLDNATLRWADGLNLPADLGAFDRILVNATIAPSSPLAALLRPAGRLAAVAAGAEGQSLIVLNPNSEGEAGPVVQLHGFSGLTPGLMRAI